MFSPKKLHKKTGGEGDWNYRQAIEVVAVRFYRRKSQTDPVIESDSFLGTGELHRDVKQLKALFKSDELVIRRLRGAVDIAVVFLSSVCDREVINRDVVRPLQESVGEHRSQTGNVLHAIHVGEIDEIPLADQVLQSLFDGNVVILLDGHRKAWTAYVQDVKQRDVEQPVTEVVIRGPHVAFNESIKDSIGLIRKRLATTRLRIETIQVGRLSRTRLAVCFIDGMAQLDAIKEVRRRLEQIDKDAIFDSGDLEQLISDQPYSPFPQFQYTERPDKAVSNLLEGRIVILIDGSPYALIGPTTVFHLLHPSEDYYLHFLPASAIRTVRYLTAFLAVFLPAIYITLVIYRQEMIPTDLLFRIAAQREGVPLPTVLEVFVMEFSFELLREAGIRLPPPAGQAVSIVGALIIGDAMINAGLVAPLTVIVTATTGIASFTIPAFHLSYGLRFLRFLFLASAAFLAFYGIFITFFFLLLHLLSLRSIGVPYLQPAYPFDLNGWKDVIVRFPFSLTESRLGRKR